MGGRLARSVMSVWVCLGCLLQALTSHMARSAGRLECRPDIGAPGKDSVTIIGASGTLFGKADIRSPVPAWAGPEQLGTQTSASSQKSTLKSQMIVET